MSCKNQVNCALCGNSAVFVGTKLGYQEPDIFNIFECPNCSTSFAVANVYSDNIYENIYKSARDIPGYDRYYRYKDKVKNVSNPLEYLADSEEAYWGVTKVLSEIQKPKDEVKILEVGCSLGYLTYSLNQEGYDAIGLDISKNAIDNAISEFGDYYVCDDVLKYSQNNEEKYDVIILTEVIEHIKEPIPFLKSLIYMLRREGKLIISTPNRSVLMKEEIWVSELPPVHWFCFSFSSLEYISKIIHCTISSIDFTEYYVNHDPIVIPAITEPVLNKDGFLINKNDGLLSNIISSFKDLLVENKFVLKMYYLFKNYRKLTIDEQKRGISLGVVFSKTSKEVISHED
jgi:SAM-dependent methyltransferase